MTEPTTPRLTEEAVREIEAAFPNAEYQPALSPDEVGPCEICKGTIDDHKANCPVPLVHLLVRDWKAMRARLIACEGSRRVHELDNHHNALACGYCAGPIKDESVRLTAENAALREQLATVESEVRGVLAALGDNAIHSHPDGGTEDIYESLAISVARLQSQLAQVASERDEAKQDAREALALSAQLATELRR